MAKYPDVKAILVQRLYAWATSPQSPSEISGQELAELIADLAGRPIVYAICSDLIAEGYLRQTRATDDDSEGWFSITSSFLDLVENSAFTSTSKDEAGSFRNFREKLLIALANKDQNNGPKYYDLKEIADEAGLQYKEGWVFKAAILFRDRGFINEAFSLGGGSDGNLDASLTADGLEEAETLGFVSSLEDPLSSNEPSDGLAIPASDRVVSLNHNSPAYQDAIAKLEQLITEVASDNAYGNEAPEEKEAIVGTLRAGRRLLDATQVRVRAATATLFPVVKYIADNFAKGAIAALAAATLAAVYSLFGPV